MGHMYSLLLTVNSTAGSLEGPRAKAQRLWRLPVWTQKRPSLGPVEGQVVFLSNQNGPVVVGPSSERLLHPGQAQLLSGSPWGKQLDGLALQLLSELVG